MKRIITLLFIAVAYNLFAQEVGIKFEQGLTQKQLFEKAKTEDKFVFIDCYATWCGPCKMMDQQVYIERTVGDYMNAHFISIKLQMDSTKGDSEDTKAMYFTASNIKRDYKVGAYPTFLFLSPQGDLVTRSEGFQNIPDFLKIAQYAYNPGNEEQVLLEKFKKGKLEATAIPSLVARLKKVGEDEEAKYVAKRFVSEFLDQLSDDQLMTRDILIILFQNLEVTKGRMLKLCLQQGNEVDKIIERKGVAAYCVNESIAWEYIYPKLWKNIAEQTNPITTKPDWIAIRDTIVRKYDPRTTEKAIVYVKSKWYKQTKEYPEFVAARMDYLRLMEFDSLGRIIPYWRESVNNIIYSDIFKHTDDHKILLQALSWQKQVVDDANDPSDIDTYANLLYKLGQKREGIKWEKKAITLKSRSVQEAFEKEFEKHPPTEEQKANAAGIIEDRIHDFKVTLQKMQAGQPTW
ncbi:MAG TPA: thioredoxin family protein [Mucilaginibacter sp.]